MNRFYVYAVLVDGVIRYIGKGINGRSRVHAKIARNINRHRANGKRIKTSRFYNKLAKALRNGASVSDKILVSGMSESAAHKREMAEIARRKGLWNELSGGDGMTSADARARYANPAYAKRMRRVLSASLRRSIAANPQIFEDAANALRKRFAEPEFAKRHSERSAEMLRRQNADPKFAKAHAARARKRARDPEWLAATREGSRKRWSNPEHVEAAAAEMRRRNADPAFIRLVTEGIRRKHATDPVFAKKHADRLRKCNADPTFTKRRLAAYRAAYADGKVGKAQSARISKQNANAKFQARRIAGLKAYFAARRVEREGRRT